MVNILLEESVLWGNILAALEHYKTRGEAITFENYKSRKFYYICLDTYEG